MSLKKLGVVLIAILALSAVAVSSASAAATTTRAEWYTGTSPGTTLPVGTDLKANLAVKPETVVKLVTHLGTNNTLVELTATASECVSCTIENKSITGVTEPAAFGTGRILFKNVTVMTPAHCEAVEDTDAGAFGTVGQVRTKPLNVHADFMNGTTAVQQFVPTAGSGTSYFTYWIEDNGGACPVDGTYSVTGSLFADAVNATGTFAEKQEVNISPAIETADGGGLFMGSKAVELTGTGVVTAETTASPPAKVKFGVH